MASEATTGVEISYEVPLASERWALDDDEAKVPENPLQVAICDLLKLILRRWCEGRGADALVSGNVALRWDPTHPKAGVDPDVYLVEPAPPLGLRDKSLRTWLPGHRPPRVAIEVVSDATADEDYHEKPQKYAVSQTRELWVFDPLLRGPKGGNAFRLQVWRRELRGGFRRAYAGDGPARSEELGAWLVVTDAGLRLRLAESADGAGLWLTGEEAERAAKETALAAKETALAAKETALAAKETALAAKETERAAKETALAAKDAALAAKETERAAKEAALAEIALLRAELGRRNS